MNKYNKRQKKTIRTLSTYISLSKFETHCMIFVHNNDLRVITTQIQSKEGLHDVDQQ